MTKYGYKYDFQNPFLVGIQPVVSNIISYTGKSEISEAKVIECWTNHNLSLFKK